MAEQVGLLTKGPHNVRLQIATEGSCSCSAEDDTVAHFFLECPVFEPQREALRDVVPVGRKCGSGLRQRNSSSRLQKHSTQASVRKLSILKNA